MLIILIFVFSVFYVGGVFLFDSGIEGYKDVPRMPLAVEIRSVFSNLGGVASGLLNQVEPFKDNLIPSDQEN